MAAPTKPTSTKQDAGARAGGANTARTVPRRPFLIEFYRSGIGKKWVMAVTGIIMMGYVFAHMVGNLKMYFGESDFNHYAEFLRVIAYPILPETGFLWVMRPLLLLAAVLHVHSAYGLTQMNRQARTTKYEQKRDYIAADFASRTMRWTGVIVLLFIIYHLLDFTFGTVNPGFVKGEVYDNVVRSFENPLVAGFYIVANLALGIHLFHGAWSLFRTLGASNPRFEGWRRGFAVAFAAIVVLGNVSFPIAVLTGIVS